MTTAQTANATKPNTPATAKASEPAAPAKAAEPAAPAKAAEPSKADKADNKADKGAAAAPPVVLVASAKPEGEQVIVVDIKDIDMSFPNARSIARDKDGKVVEVTVGEEENSFSALCSSILIKGQEMPVILRPNPSNRANKKPYQLVAGFRRVAAISKLAEEGKKTPHVAAVVRELNDLQATQTNTIENTSRDGLAAPDVCWAAMMNKNQMIANGLQVSDEMVAQTLGLSTAWINRLLRIANGLDGGVLKKWRESPVAVKVSTMVGIAKRDKAEQDAAFEKAVQEITKPKEKDPQKKGNTSWMTTCERDAQAIGTFLAQMEFEGNLTLNQFEWSEAVDFISPRLAAQRGKVGTGRGQVREDHIKNAEVLVAKHVELAYQETLERLENGDGEEEDQAEE